jgi:hypothetical protein
MYFRTGGFSGVHSGLWLTFSSTDELLESCSFDALFCTQTAQNCPAYRYVPQHLVISNFKLRSACIVIKNVFSIWILKSCFEINSPVIFFMWGSCDMSIWLLLHNLFMFTLFFPYLKVLFKLFDVMIQTYCFKWALIWTIRNRDWPRSRRHTQSEIFFVSQDPGHVIRLTFFPYKWNKHYPELVPSKTKPGRQLINKNSWVSTFQLVTRLPFLRGMDSVCFKFIQPHRFAIEAL